MQPWRRRDNLIYALPFCSRIVLGPLAVAARRLLAAAEVDGLHSFNTARLAELQGLDLGMDCREEQRCNELHGAATGDLWGRGIDAMVQWAAVLREQCVKVQLQQLII